MPPEALAKEGLFTDIKTVICIQDKYACKKASAFSLLLILVLFTERYIQHDYNPCMKSEDVSKFIFTPKGLELIKKSGISIEGYKRYWKSNCLFKHEDRGGQKWIIDAVQGIPKRYERAGVVIEHLSLPAGEFRRVTKNGQMISFRNLTESRKARLPIVLPDEE